MLTVTSNPNSITEVTKYVNKLISRHKICPQRQGDIMISTTEAVNNAMIHGNSMKPEKKVVIRTRCHKDSLEVIVRDEGPGFDYTNVPDPTAPENICKCGGRGVFLMKELSDDISFKDNGSTVKMSFYL